MYDTQYAMVDRNDDLKIGVKSTAILFGRYDKIIIGILQLVMLALLVAIGVLLNMKGILLVIVTRDSPVYLSTEINC